MDISIILPVYKPQYYTWECLDSIIKQTINKSKFELIIILNGCNEPYYSRLKDYIEQYMLTYNVKLIQIDTPGVSNARNLGLDIANGQYIGFIDDDDYVSPIYLQELYDIAVTGQIPISNVIAFEDKSYKIMPYYVTDSFKANMDKGSRHIIQVRSFFSIPVAKLINKEIIAKRRFNVKYKNGEDGLFMLLISDRIKKIGLTSSSAIYYRRNRLNSASSKEVDIQYKLTNCTKLIVEYVAIYFKRPFYYNFLFVSSRILAEMIDICISIKNK